jgi:uncharacterized protein (TIGR00255 family)
LENRVREILAGGIARGRVSVNVEIDPGAAGQRLSLDEDLASEYREILRTLSERYGIDGPLDAVTFAQLPDVIRKGTPQIPLDSVEKIVEEALGDALAQLGEMREREGAALRRDLVKRIDRLGTLLDRIAAAAEGAPEVVRKRLEEKIRTLVPPGTNPDPERLATEVAVICERADVVEEIVRFRAHNEAFLAFLDAEEATGKRLDFLLQEMNREINTIGAKSMSAEIAHLVVEMKEEIERLREQVQNVE